MSQTDRERDGLWMMLAVVGALLPFARIVFLGEIPMAHDIQASDLLHAHSAYDVAIGQALRAGQAPLWLDGPFLGMSLTGQIEAAPLYPPRLLALWLFPQWTAFGLLLGLHVAIATAGAYGLSRAVGLSPPAAALVGLGFGASGFVAAHLKHPNMIASAAYLPWIYLAIQSVARRPLLALIVGPAAVAGTWLGGHPQIAYYGLIAAGIVALWVHRRSVWALASAAGLVVLGTCLAGAQLLVTGRFVSQTLRAEADWAFAQQSPVQWPDLFFWLEPTMRGDPYGDSYLWLAGSTTMPWEVYGHVGLLALPLAVVAFFSPPPTRRFAVALAGAAAVLLAFALGPATPVFGLAWATVPGMSLFRFPSRIIVLLGLVVALLGGLGLQALLNSALPWRRWIASAIVLFTAVQLTWAHRAWVRSDDAAAWTAPSPWVEAARADAPAAPRVYVLASRKIWEEVFDRHHGFRDGLAPFRALAGLPIGNRALDFGVVSPDGYSAMTHERPAWFWIHANRSRIDGAPELVRVDDDGALPEPHRRRLAKAGVTHAIVPEGRPWSGEVLFEQGGHRLVRLRDPRPPAAIHTAWTGASTWAEARRLADEVDESVVEGADGHERQARAPIAVRVERPGPNELRVPTGGAGGLLVLAESWDEGWRATIDGVPAPVLIADGYQRAILVPEGAREVVFRFWPAGFTAGLTVSAAGLVLWGALIALVARRRRAP